MRNNPASSPFSSPLRPITQSRRWIASGIFLLFSYWLYGYRPIAAFPWSAVDDGLYLRHAEAFINWLSGHNPRWLGDYDYFLLSKAPLYGVFLGFLNLLCVPVRVGEFVLLAGLPFLFSLALRPVSELRGWRFFLIAALLVWLPLLPSETHLLRNALQSILTSYLIIAAMGLALCTKSRRPAQLKWAALVGVTFSLCYLNREEAAWLAVIVLLSLFVFSLQSWLNRCFSWRRIALIGGGLGLCSMPLILLVCTLNYCSYGLFLTTFRRSDAFIAAYQRMTSLEPEFRQAYIPISRATRFRAYALSPSFARLQPFLEGKSSYWVAGNEGHSLFNGHSPAENEFFISNYEFALEYAAYCSGATSASDAERLFSNINHELASAIGAGRIPAGMHGPATLAAFQKGDGIRIVKAWVESLRALLTLRRAELDWSAQSSGEAAALAKVSLFVHSSLTPEDQIGIHFRIRRWLVAGINDLLRAVYLATLPALIVFSLLSYLSNRAAFYRLILVGLIPLSAVVLFCLAMAVLETLGFKFLSTMGYNVLGYSPVSVLSAFTVVLALTYFQRSNNTGIKSGETAPPTENAPAFSPSARS